MDAATKAMIARLRPEVLSLKRDRPEEFNNLIAPNKGNVAIVLLGIQDGRPFAIRTEPCNFRDFTAGD
jgi:hypothetical protein